MTARVPFWRVVPGAREGEYILPVTPPATAGPEGAPHVMGGVSLAAAIDAMQLESGQDILWATIQFLAPTQHAEELTISCEQCGGGQSIGQWQAVIRSAGREVQRVAAALGAREPSEPRQFAAMPDVPGPGSMAAPPVDPLAGDTGLLAEVERRTALQDSEQGIEAVWTRSRSGFANDAGWLAILSDFFLGAHPQSRGGSSLDATFRFFRPAPAGWVLSVTQLAAFERGTVSGQARHFAEDGTLLAISSQTGVLPRIPMVMSDSA